MQTHKKSNLGHPKINLPMKWIHLYDIGIFYLLDALTKEYSKSPIFLCSCIYSFITFNDCS